jgi:16S rRNA (cytidine1402-2'-O)-methyltransferase
MRGTLADLAAQLAEDEPKGEAVILVAGAVAAVPDQSEWQPALASALRDQPLRAAVDDIAARFGLKRKQVYDAALALKSRP